MLQLLLKKEAIKSVTEGNPWIFSGMIAMTSELEMASPGSLVNILDNRAKPIAVGYFNPKSQLACRVLSNQPNTVINQRFFANLFAKALAKREKLFPHPYYRLVHSEGDGTPGLIVDRFGDTVVCQTSTAGMENLKPIWLPALQEVVNTKRIVHRDDIPARKKEGLELQVLADEDLSSPIEVKEHDCIYYANLLTGQKTGWFYDQRANRHYFAGLVKDKNVLDIYSHSGGFGIASAKGGAANVTMVDSSSLALELASQAAEMNGVESVCEFTRSDAYEYLEECVNEGKRFQVIMADPPAFIKEKKYTASGLKGYQKLAHLCASALEKDGIFAIASCSHHAAARDFRRAVEQGIKKTGRNFELIHKAGADKDHPVHPILTEGQYLKFMVFKVE